MDRFNELSSWDQTVRLFAGFFIVLLLIYYIYGALKPPFLTTVSPDKSYTVELYGQKERPAFFTVEVGAVVLKEGSVFWPYETLHSGDFMDLSFELGWPDHRWIGNNLLQFYQKENLSESSYREKLTLTNGTQKTIRQLFLRSSADKFLGFDLPPGEEIELIASPSKGDYSDVWLSCRFDDGEIIEKGAAFDVRNGGKSLVLRIAVWDNDIYIQRLPPTHQ